MIDPIYNTQNGFASENAVNSVAFGPFISPSSRFTSEKTIWIPTMKSFDFDIRLKLVNGPKTISGERNQKSDLDVVQKRADDASLVANHKTE